MAGLLGCSSDTATPGATLLSAIKHYQSEMASIGSSPERWPERQRTAGTFKTVVAVMMERPVEFNRMIDLDLKAKEFAVTMPTLAPESARIKEMTMEVGEMNRELAGLAERVEVQVAAMPVAAEDKVSAVATQGLLVIAVNSFVPANDSSANRSRQVGEYFVTDLGQVATVRAPDGKMFKCAVVDIDEEGARVRCQPSP
jgi:hypothetical protein